MKLQTPRRDFTREHEQAVRPTKAVVRKSIFQRLEPFAGREVCDLFAGIGTLGIEALSRGASHVTFIERDRRILGILRKNLAVIKADEHSTVTPGDATLFLSTTSRQFDIVLADPPYGSLSWDSLWPLANNVLLPEGIFVMELPRNAPMPDGIDARVFGKTKVGLLRKAR